jgi:hypothetical protein
MRPRGFYQHRTGAICTSKNAVKAKESQNAPSTSFGDVGASCTPVRIERGRSGSSSPREGSTHP